MLKKNLYGLKQAPCQWYSKFESFIFDNGFKVLNVDNCVYTKRYKNDNFIVLLLYVDDMFIVGRDKSMINKLK